MRALALLGRCSRSAVATRAHPQTPPLLTWLRPGPAMCIAASPGAPPVHQSASHGQRRSVRVLPPLRQALAPNLPQNSTHDTPTRNYIHGAAHSLNSSSTSTSCSSNSTRSSSNSSSSISCSISSSTGNSSRSISSSGSKDSYSSSIHKGALLRVPPVALRCYSQVREATPEPNTAPEASAGGPRPPVASPMAGPTVVNPESLPWALEAVRGFIPDLSSSKHKGQAGRIAVVGGCREYTGAPFFSSIAALRLGADLSHVLCSRDAAPVIKGYSPELIVHPLLKESYELQFDSPEERQRMVAQVVEEVSYWVTKMDCVVVGPGLGRDPFMMDCIAEIMTKAREASVPMVIDADGLFLVNQRLDLVRGYPLAILTPNVAELKRLQDSLAEEGSQLVTADPNKDPLGALQEMAARLGHVTLLQKGRVDTVTDGRHVIQVDAYGSPRRCGGQGDILAGSMAVLFAWAHKWSQATVDSAALREALSQDPGSLSHVTAALSDNPGMLAATAACLAVRHAAAATFATRKRSMVTGDLIHQLGDSFEALFPVGPWESNPRL